MIALGAGSFAIGPANVHLDAYARPALIAACAARGNYLPGLRVGVMLILLQMHSPHRGHLA
jgi:hypothetical protein